MLTVNNTQRLRQMSGEELLLQAIFCKENLKKRIDHELDRRAHCDLPAGRGVSPHAGKPFASFSGYAA